MFRMGHYRKEKSRPLSSGIPLHIEVRTKLRFEIIGRSDVAQEKVWN
jgi:hypothetical protein